MKIVSWNVNSIKTRLEHVKQFIGYAQPDILMLQELKGLEFPAAAFEELGYQTDAVVQKAYNGVAMISKVPFKVVHNKLPGDDTDDHARYLEIETGGMRVINIYAPNGNPVDTEKFPYKLGWLTRLQKHLKELVEDNVPFAIGGDFNVIPEDKDCWDPKVWIQDALFRIESRQKLRAIMNLGMTDAFRVFNNAPGQYTFWDYQAGAWQRNMGIRIDHFLLSPQLTDRLVSCSIDKEPRGWDKPSDHTPIIVEIAA
jgi:exodeoxyribonuclease-3